MSRDLLLGVDTSCDETSIALLDQKTGAVLANCLSSQIDLHAPFGGIVPELASRAHAENLWHVVGSALQTANAKWNDLGSVAVTAYPGLIGCLLVGTAFAQGLAWRHKLPLHAIDHLESHLFSPLIGRDPVFPFLGLVVSGGHTSFYRVESFEKIESVGQTIDDAAGEAFDKCAKLMGLSYPGGPLVDRLAQQGRDDAFSFAEPKIKLGPQYLSFSGLKTAVSQLWKSSADPDQIRVDLCASVQKAIVEQICHKAEMFLQQGDYKALTLSGGVAMNSRLRKDFATLARKHSLEAILVEPQYATDNAAMVAHMAWRRPSFINPIDLQPSPSRKIHVRDVLAAEKKNP